MTENSTQLLIAAGKGRQASADALLPLVYDELRAIAADKMRRERPDHTLQPTALVNEAFLRMIDQTQVDWQSRSHFRAMAATMMRRILIDHARARAAGKRGANVRHVPFDDALMPSLSQDPVSIVAVGDLLGQLEKLNERHARIVELRCFGGLTVQETAQCLDVSPATVKNDWRVARAWLLARLTDEDSGA